MKPVLDGQKTTLRTMSESDKEDLFEIYGNIETMEFSSDSVFESIDMVDQMLSSVRSLELSGESLEWAVVCKESHKVVGTCGLHSFSKDGKKCEVGCLLNSCFWRQGYMSDALKVLFEYARTKGVLKVVADIDEQNIRSKGFFLSLGFEHNEQNHYQLKL